MTKLSTNLPANAIQSLIMESFLRSTERRNPDVIYPKYQEPLDVEAALKTVTADYHEISRIIELERL